MPRRTGFSVVEAIVGTTMLGVAAAMLAAALGVLRSVRASADARSASAQAAGERVATLARRSCTAGDTAGVDRRGRAVTRWAATPAGAAWTYADSTSVPGGGPAVVIEGQVLCPP